MRKEEATEVKSIISGVPLSVTNGLPDSKIETLGKTAQFPGNVKLIQRFVYSEHYWPLVTFIIFLFLSFFSFWRQIFTL